MDGKASEWTDCEPETDHEAIEPDADQPVAGLAPFEQAQSESWPAEVHQTINSEQDDVGAVGEPDPEVQRAVEPQNC